MEEKKGGRRDKDIEEGGVVGREFFQKRGRRPGGTRNE